MFRSRKERDVDKVSGDNLSADLVDAKHRLLSRRDAMRKAGESCDVAVPAPLWSPWPSC
jgi:hypothetical protein